MSSKIRKRHYLSAVRRAAFCRNHFPFPLIFFSISKQFFPLCAESFCYKLCNAYYKLCNTCYKLSNTCYKVCNKKFLYDSKKYQAERKKQLRGKKKVKPTNLKAALLANPVRAQNGKPYHIEPKGVGAFCRTPLLLCKNEWFVKGLASKPFILFFLKTN